MPLPTLNERAPIDLPRAEAAERELAASIAGVPLDVALGRYHALLETFSGEGLGDAKIACASGCTTCCHQPILVSFVEIGQLVFSDEKRFLSPEFRASLRTENNVLKGWRRDGARDGAALARRQFKERRRCLLLDDKGRCSVYEARPFICRNAWALNTCTYENLETFGFPDLAALGRRLRHLLHRTYALERFDTPTVKTATAAFYLSEGLAWFLDTMPIAELRPLFAPAPATG